MVEQREEKFTTARTHFETSRELEYFSEKELELQIGCERDAWATARGLTQAPGDPCPLRVLGWSRRRREAREWWYTFPFGWADHPSLWRRDGRAVLFCSHPYQLSDADRAALATFCIRHGLAFSVEPREASTSWYYPGGTLLIEIWKAGEPKPGGAV